MYIWIYLDFLGFFIRRFVSLNNWILEVLHRKLGISGFIRILLVFSSGDLIPYRFGFLRFFTGHWKYLDLFGFFWFLHREILFLKRLDPRGSSPEIGDIWIYSDSSGFFIGRFDSL